MKLSWQQISSPIITEILCYGFDGVVLDTEHGCFNKEALYACVQIATLQQKKCLVRLTDIDPTLIRHCLDAGASGLIFSTIETSEQCQKIINLCCYSPRGKRGLGLVRQNFWGSKGLLSADPIIIPQVETKKAIDNLEYIIKFNFDYYLIGPYDLSLSLNIPGKFDKPEFLRYTDKVKGLISPESLAVHIPNDVTSQLPKYEGYGIKCLGMDTIAILEYNKEILKNA